MVSVCAFWEINSIVNNMLSDSELVENRNVSKNVTETVAEFSLEVKNQLAYNPTTSKDTLTELATSDSVPVRYGVAKHTNTPVETLLLLLEDSNENVRSFVMANPNLPADTLEKIVDDVLKTVTEDSLSSDISVSINPSLSQEHIRKLSTHPNDLIRCGIAENKATPVFILKMLAGDASRLVAEGLASNPNTPTNVLTLLAVHETWQVRSIVARNPSTLPSTLSDLALDDNLFVRTWIARNPNTSRETLDMLLGDSNIKIRDEVMELKVKKLEDYIEKLPSRERATAKLLAPTFTGWPQDLATLIPLLHADFQFSVSF